MIKFLVMDVDGTLTDGKIYMGVDGECLKAFDIKDGYALHTLLKDIHSRQAVMLYTRPSMQKEANENGRHDFMCTYAVQCFLNEVTNDQGDDGLELKYIVFMRSNDAVFGFDNDVIWHKYVAEKLAKDIEAKLNNDSFKFVTVAPIEWNAASLHVYERHFKYLEE